MIPINVSLSHYKRIDIQEEIIVNSQDREVVAKFNDIFFKRPDVLRNKNDILELAKQGATSFHASEELWKNVFQIGTSLKKYEIDNLRIGWDLVIDIDCVEFEYSKIAADSVIKFLKFNGVNSVSCKFSGNKGFHIGVPSEAFPERIGNKDIKKMFPDAPRRIALFIKSMILPEFSKRLIEHEKGNVNAIMEKTGRIYSEIIVDSKSGKILNSEPILQMDTLLISPRHLYRMPYSLHEKSGLVSTPFNPDKVLMFRKEFALPKNIKISKHRFLDNTNVEKYEARQLFITAFDYTAEQEMVKADGRKEFESRKEFEAPHGALPEEMFPPCIKLILNGLEDGKKRALFILVNYFTSIGWEYGAIEKRLLEWNTKNVPPLRDVNLLGQLRYHKQMKKRILPPNCSNDMYMLGIGVCKPDNFCAKIKNPTQYTTKKVWMMNFGR